MTEQSKAPQDIDPIETQEWQDALDSVINYENPERAQFILQRLLEHASAKGLSIPSGINTPYVNTIPTEQQAALPANAALMERLTHYMRWNVLVMVMRAAHKKQGLGGHISSYASIATLFEVGLTYFFHADDLIFFQGHSAEGIYARAFLEGRLSKGHLMNFREEAFKEGLSSYPHPHLMPNFWQFPTVSMGLGPFIAVHEAQFLKYLHNRGLSDTSQRKVWAFCGDGEMGEPESQGSIIIAAREKLDNLIFVINCNLQRLDGPVCGNSQVIQEFEGIFHGAGWRVIKVIWGSNWEKIFNRDKTGLLMKRIGELVDGEYQSYSAHDGAYMRDNFFGKYPELLELVADLSDDELKQLTDGGHDPQKVYAAYHEAMQNCGKPTVILAKTVKGYGYGKEGEGLNITHNLEELSAEGLKEFRDRFELPLTDKQIADLEFYRPADDSEEIKFIKAQREKLGGFLPSRDASCDGLKVPDLSIFEPVLKGSGDREISTSMAFARILMILLKDKNIKERIVPIVADEARSLGLEGLFRQAGIYAVDGQCYTPEDRKQLVYYREEKSGQVLQQGLCEAAAISSWLAAATAYVNQNIMMIPFYAYYSMFGYQRVGDFIWAAGDMQARGFLVGGTSGRTTLPGEGLQHQDGHNLLMFGVVPSCRSYDPAFGYEIAVIVQDGLRRMYQDQENVFYYFNIMNESYQQPAMPQGIEQGIIDGLYLWRASDKKQAKHVQLLGSGAILREVIFAADLLAKEFGVAADVWSATSFNLLRRDIESVQRYNRLHPDKAPKESTVEKCLAKQKGPVIAATDYVKLYADQIRSAVKQPYYVLGTDGVGRSDIRSALRDFFEVNAAMIAYTALKALMNQGALTSTELLAAQKKLNIDPKRLDPWTL